MLSRFSNLILATLVVAGLLPIRVKAITPEEQAIATRLAHLSYSYLKKDRGSKIASHLLLAAQKLDPDNHMVHQITECLAENRLEMVWVKPQQPEDVIRILIARGDELFNRKVAENKKVGILCSLYWQLAYEIGAKKELIVPRLRELKEKYKINVSLNRILYAKWTAASLFNVKLKEKKEVPTSSYVEAQGTSSNAYTPSTATSSSTPKPFEPKDLKVTVHVKKDYDKIKINSGYRKVDTVVSKIELENRNRDSEAVITVKGYLIAEELNGVVSKPFKVVTDFKSETIRIPPKGKIEIKGPSGKIERTTKIYEYHGYGIAERRTEEEGYSYEGWIVIVYDQAGRPIIVKRKNSKIEKIARTLKLLPNHVDVGYDGICKNLEVH
ncbi:MAG: hypothetical protein D6820_12145 [Lentisphaerae bacterium]|nr:MAG: hypothetical protein D6820_12145 [Lentisphaerota bacterium]